MYTVTRIGAIGSGVIFSNRLRGIDRIRDIRRRRAGNNITPRNALRPNLLGSPNRRRFCIIFDCSLKILNDYCIAIYETKP